MILFSFAGCAKCIDTRYENVGVNIVDKVYSPAWVQTISTGKSVSVITHPAVYAILVEYNGTEYRINGRDTYHKYKGKVGQRAVGKLEIKTYDNNTIKYNIVSLE